jgi:hypothetical protein
VGQINGVWAATVTNPPGATWVIIVGDSIMYGSFDNFQAVIDSSQFTETWQYDSTAQQEVYYAQIIIDGDTVNNTWAKDSNATTGIKNITPASGLSVYPNPANTRLNVVVDNPVSDGKVEIYNTIGELVYQSPINDKTTTIQTSQWNDGLYAVRVSSSSGTVTRCFVISH